MKNTIIDDFNLPKYVKGKTFAEASKAINNKFKDRNDVHSKQTKEDLLGRLAEAQEYIKMQESLKSTSKEVPDQMMGEVPPGMEEFAYGGSMSDEELLRLQELESKNEGLSVGTGALQGASAGSSFGPYGAAAGAVVGGLTGLLGANKQNEKIKDHNVDLNRAKNFMYRPSTFAEGGLMQYSNSRMNSTPVQNQQPINNINSSDASINQEFSAYDKNLQGNVGGLSDTQKGIMQGMETTKDAIATAIPIAGIFRGVEKGGKALGKAVGGETGADVAGGVFDPATGQMQVLTSDDLTAEEAVFSIINPVGASVLAGKKRQEKKNDAMNKQSKIKSSKMRQSTFAYGGNMDKKKSNKYAPGGWWDNAFGMVNNVVDNNQANIDAINNLNPSTPINTQDYYSTVAARNNAASNTTNNSKGKNKVVDWLGKNYGDILSYAPLASEMFNKIEKPTTQRGARLTGRYKKDNVDERALQNIVNQSGVNRALSESSGGDLGALRNNILGANLNKTKALSNAYLQADEINRRENTTAQQFNTNLDRFNATQEERYIDRAARDQGAYSTAKNQQRRAIAEDIGKIGREQSNKGLVKEMFGYKWNGEYWVDPKTGDKKTEKEFKEMTSTNDNMFGGFLKKNKK